MGPSWTASAAGTHARGDARLSAGRGARAERHARGSGLLPALQALILAAFCGPAFAAKAAPLSLETSDGWTLAALYRAPAKGKPVAVLVHGVAASKEEWTGLSEKLWALGYGTLALDLRGHGGSTKGPRGTETFRELDARSEWPTAAGDLLAAVKRLRARGVSASRVVFVGGSIGANLASQAAGPAGVKKLVLLSPGLDYRGVGLADVSGEKVCVAASPQDAYAFQTAMTLASSATFLQAPRGHGAQMLEDQDFTQRLLACIQNLK